MVILRKINKRIGKDKDLKEIAKGGSLSFIINLTGMGFGYIFIFLISKIYGSDSAAIYGKYVLVTLLLRIASIVTRFGTDTAMLRFTAAYAPQKLWGNIRQIHKKLVTIIICFGVVVSFVVILGASLWGKWLKLPSDIIIIAGFFVLPLALGLFYSQSLRGLKKIGISSFLRSSSLPILNFILLPSFLFFTDKQSPFFIDLPSYTFFAAILLTAIIGLYFWYRSMPSYGNTHSEDYDKGYNELFKSSYPLLLVESMTFMSVWIDQLMLGLLGTNEDVGIFNVCVKYAMIASLSVQALNTVSAPKFSEYFFKKDFKSLAKNFRSTTKMIFWTSFPIVLSLVLFPNFFMNLLGDSFENGSVALIFLSIASLINVMTGSVGTLLQMTGNQNIMQRILLTSVFIELVLNALLIPYFGVAGAAFASLGGNAVRNFSMSFYVRKYFGFTSIYVPFLKFKNQQLQ